MSRPYPASGNCTVFVMATHAADAQLMFRDVLGRVVYIQQARVEHGNNRYELPSSLWGKGIYIVSLKCGESMSTVRVVVQ